MKHLSLPIIVETDSDGYFVSCPALQGCYSQGETYEEAVENIKDAIRGCIQALDKELFPPTEKEVAYVEVVV